MHLLDQHASLQGIGETARVQLVFVVRPDAELEAATQMLQVSLVSRRKNCVVVVPWSRIEEMRGYTLSEMRFAYPSTQTDIAALSAILANLQAGSPSR